MTLLLLFRPVGVIVSVGSQITGNYQREKRQRAESESKRSFHLSLYTMERD